MNRSLVGGLLAAVLAVVAAPAAADVKLNPGTVQGTAGLEGWDLTSGQVSIGGNANGFSSTTWFNGSSFSLTTEGNQTYGSLSVYMYGSGVNYSFARNRAVEVPAGGTITVDLRRPGAVIVPQITVLGGSVGQANFWVNGNDGTGAEYFSASAYLNGSSAIRLPVAVLGSKVTVSGSLVLNVVDVDGRACTVQRSFPWQQVDVASGQTLELAQTYDVTLETCSSGIAGNIDYRSPPQGLSFSGGRVYVSNSVYKDSYFYSLPATYAFEGLTSNSSYWTNASLWFREGGSLELPGRAWVTVGDGVTVKDFVADGAAVRRDVRFTGPWAGRLQASANVYYSGTSTASYNGWSYGYGNLSRGANVVSTLAPLTSGEWRPNQLSLWAYDDSSSPRVSESLYEYGSAFYGMALNPAAGETVSAPEYTLDTSEATIVFDVVEPEGSPVIGISNPRVYARQYDASGNAEYIYAYGDAYNAPIAQVRLVGRPGRYSFDAWANVRNSDTRFASSTVDLGQATNTPVGSNVQIVPRDSTGAETPVGLTFGSVTTGGETTVSMTDVGPAAPADYDLLSIIEVDGKDTKYLNVNTSAQFTGKVQVAIAYDPAVLGISDADEARLVLQQYVCVTSTDCHWEVINQSNDPNDARYFGPLSFANGVDTANDVVYGVTTSLSTFAVTLRTVVLVPPTNTCVGESAAPAQLRTDAGVCSVTVDNTNKLAGGCDGGGGGLLACTYDSQTSPALALGAHTVAVAGTSVDGSASSCTSYVNVVDREAPAVTCAAPRVVECKGAATPAAVSAACQDNCASCAAGCGAGSFSLGKTAVSCNGSDDAGNSASCTTSVTVVDTTPPELALSVSPAVLWPPNHKLVSINVSRTFSDLCDGTASVTCSARSSDADNGLGDGDTVGDIQWKGGQLFLRAERTAGSPRTYTVTCAATDVSGNRTERSATVTVPME